MMDVNLRVDVDIDVSDVYDELSDDEKRELADWLYNDHIIDVPPSKNTNTTLLEDELIEKLSKIMQSYVRLTQEQIETIEKIYQTL
jgi:hypothetical protein